MQKHQKLFANFGMLMAAMIWGSTFIVIKKSLGGVNAVTLVCYRFALAALVVGIVLLISRKSPLRHVKEGFILGFMVLVSYLLQTLGLNYVSASSSGFITGLFLIFVPIFSFMFGREKMSWSIFIAIVLAMTGLWKITGGISEFNVGEILTLGSAAMLALYIVYADTIVRKCDLWILNFHQFLFTAVASLIGMVIFKLPFAVSSGSAIFGILYLSLFANVIAYAIQLNVQKFISPIICVLLLSTELVFAAMFAWTLGGEKILAKDVIGGLLIISAIVFAQIAEMVKAAKISKS